MSNLLIPSERDPVKRGKDCPDWCPMPDGTKTGDPKYCELSRMCRQLGYRSDWAQIVDAKTGEILDHDYLCTGRLIDDPEEVSVDEEAK